MGFISPFLILSVELTSKVHLNGQIIKDKMYLLTLKKSNRRRVAFLKRKYVTVGKNLLIVLGKEFVYAFEKG